MSAHLEFEVLFSEGFSFETEGNGNPLYPNGYPFMVGKLHGLGPHNPITGREDTDPDGWSVRIYWKKNTKTHQHSENSPLYVNDFTKFSHNKNVVFGVNYYGQDRETGDSGKFIPSDWTEVETEVWYKFSLYVKINAVDKADDIIELDIYEDDVRVGGLSVDNIKLIKRRGEIERFLFSTFFGGGSSEFRPKKDNMKAYFKNFKIKRY